jgi:hypothetical protein
MRALTLLALILLAAPAAAADKVDTSKIEELARSIGKAILDGDYAKVADPTHPNIVEVMGGKEKTIEQTRALMNTLKDQGFTFKEYTVGKPEAPVIDGKTAYVIIPTVLKIDGPKVKLEGDGYLIGISTDQGKTWTFADGAGMDNPKLKKAVFPTLPAGLKLPANKPPTVTKE